MTGVSVCFLSRPDFCLRCLVEVLVFVSNIQYISKQTSRKPVLVNVFDKSRLKDSFTTSIVSILRVENLF